MSSVTTVVIVGPDEWDDAEARHLGHVAWKAQAIADGAASIDPDEAYPHLAHEANGLDITGGTKVPGGRLFWLGINYAHMTEILAALDADPACHGAWVWYQAEDATPATHMVGGGQP